MPCVIEWHWSCVEVDLYKKKGNQRTDNFAIIEVMFPNAFFKYFYFKMLFILKIDAIL